MPLKGPIRSAAESALTEVAIRLIREAADNAVPVAIDVFNNDVLPGLRYALRRTSDFVANPPKIDLRQRLPKKKDAGAPTDDAPTMTNMAEAFVKARKAHLAKVKDDERAKQFAEAMRFCTRLVAESKETIANPPEGVVATLQDCADLLELSNEISNRKSVDALNKILDERRGLLEDEFASTFEEMLGRELYAGGMLLPIDADRFRQSLIELPRPTDPRSQ